MSWLSRFFGRKGKGPHEGGNSLSEEDRSAVHDRIDL